MKRMNCMAVIISLMVVACASSVLANRGVQSQLKIEKLDRAPLKLLDARYSVEDGKLVIKGKVKNTRSRVMPGIFVVARFYDSAGKLIDTKKKHTIGSIHKLKGNRQSKYTIKVDYSPQIVLCQLEVDWRRGE